MQPRRQFLSFKWKETHQKVTPFNSKKKKVPPFQSQESRTIQLTFFYFNFFFKMTINYYNSVTYAITQKNEAALDFLKSYFKEYDWFNIDMQLFN